MPNLTRTSIATKRVGDSLSVSEFNQINISINTAVDALIGLLQLDLNSAVNSLNQIKVLNLSDTVTTAAQLKALNIGENINTLTQSINQLKALPLTDTVTSVNSLKTLNLASVASTVSTLKALNLADTVNAVNQLKAMPLTDTINSVAQLKALNLSDVATTVYQLNDLNIANKLIAINQNITNLQNLNLTDVIATVNSLKNLNISSNLDAINRSLTDIQALNLTSVIANVNSLTSLPLGDTITSVSRLNALNLDTLVTKVNQLQTTQTSANTKITQLQTDQTAATNAITTIQANQVLTNSAITAIQSAQTDANNNITQLQSGLSDITASVNQIKASGTGNNSGASSADITALQNSQAATTLAVNQLQALPLTDTITSVNYLKTLNLDTLQNQIVKDYSGLTNIPTGNYIVAPNTFAFAGIVANSTYVITQNFDLGGATITLPANVNLVFNGGKISNGILTGNKANITATNVTIFNGVTLAGTWRVRSFLPEWWGDSTFANASYDWRIAIQSALDAAFLNGGEVMFGPYVYKYTGGLVVNAGVTIRGVGRGETVFGSGSAKGTVIYCSSGNGVANNVALKVIGKMVTIYDIFLKGSQQASDTTTGLQIYGVGPSAVANQAIIENCAFKNVVIHGFLGGIGMHLVAGNGGAVTYCDFNDIRFRNCRYHVKIESLSSKASYGNIGSTGLAFNDATGFLNSNNFYGFYCSGYAETCLWMRSEVDDLQVNSQDVYRPCNNMQFSGVIMEPPYTASSHIRIEGGGTQLRMHDIRIEAAQQDTKYPAVPVIYLGAKTNGCLIDCDQTNITIQDLGYNNTINQRSVKNANATPSSTNLWKNSSLVGLLANTSANLWILPEWTIEEQCIDPNNTYAWRPLQATSAITISYDTDVMMDGYKAISFSVPPTYMLRVTQGVDRTKYNLTHAKFNCYVKSTGLKDVTFTYQDAVTPIFASGGTFGTGSYEPIGGLFPITPVALSSYYRVALFVQNYGSSNINFSFTRPSFVTGDTITQDAARPIRENGGTMYGVLGYNTVKNIQPVNNAAHRGTNYSDVILPQEGNYFEISDTNFPIQKINATTSRFPRGSVITLYFTGAGVSLVSSGLLNIYKEFISEAGATITLQSVEGDGTWREISRYSKKIAGTTTVDVAALTTDNISYVLPADGSNLYTITNTTDSSFTIQRLNNATNRFYAGALVMLTFSSPNSKVQITNSAYITLAKTGSYTPADGDWILLSTTGNGTWMEVQRKQSVFPIATKGANTLDIATTGVFVNPSLIISQAGENSFTLNNTSASGASIQRINDGATQRLLAGTEIMISFGTLTSSVNFVSSAYLVLSTTTSYTPSTGDWIKLSTDGNGVWKEISRKALPTPTQNRGLSTLVLSSSNLVSNFLTIAKTGENYIKIDATSYGGNITRINNAAADRLPAGTMVVIKFINVTTSVALVHSGYISLAGATNFTPAVNNIICLITAGDGTWEELYRRTT